MSQTNCRKGKINPRKFLGNRKLLGDRTITTTRGNFFWGIFPNQNKPKKDNRMSRDSYFMEIAKLTSKRSTCRVQVGAIAVKNSHIIMSSYNGSPRHVAHCTDAGCQMVNGHCKRTVHAEQNIIVNCAKNGIALDGATIYCTHEPCYDCTKLLYSAGVFSVIYLYSKKDNNTLPYYKSFTVKYANILRGMQPSREVLK